MILHCALCGLWRRIKGRGLCGACHERARRVGALGAFPCLKWRSDTTLELDDQGEPYYRKKSPQALYCMEWRAKRKAAAHG